MASEPGEPETALMIEENKGCSGPMVVPAEESQQVSGGGVVEREARAVVLTGFGALSKLRVMKRSVPAPRRGEVLLCVKACGMNFLDLMVRQGNMENPPRTPIVPGFECSGLVEMLGEGVENFQVGEGVMAVMCYGAWAELACVPVENVFPLPPGMSFTDGAAFPVSFLTAYLLLFDIGRLREGMSVLVHSAGGGVGQAVAQLCATVPGVTLFGTASSSKHEAIRGSLLHLIDRNADYVTEVKKISPEGVDIVLDCLCGEHTAKGLSLLKPMGTCILYGSSNMVTGETKSFFSFAKSWWQVEKVNPLRLYEENKCLAGFQLLPLLTRPDGATRVRHTMARLTHLYIKGVIRPRIDSVWALEEVKEAMQRIHDRGNVGKILLEPEKAPIPLMASDSTDTSEACDEEGEEDESECKEREPFIH
uniref:Vesicle amine transport 1-like n=2 Tax=Eptatretus burgeri TaxID=7764 RepID=A0A8C4QZG5_EPTBU